MNKARILIVEDELIVAQDLKNRLRLLGYDVVGAVMLGEQAIVLADTLRPDLVLMDIRLEGEMDGIVAAERIRRDFRLPIVFLTAYSEEDTIKRAKVVEPFGYIIKPFEDREIRSTIEIALYKHQAEKKLRDSERRYATTLASIGDGVIATDALGEVTFLNHVAERLTGWIQAEANGRPLREVFRIANEQTRQAVEDPVAKVLREGRIVGLANHTILISRDGREIPIDDCGAPIFDDSGAVSGTVLVFQDVSERRRKEAELRRIEWMLSPRTPAARGAWAAQRQGYGDMTALNTSRFILDAVGPDLLSDIVGDYLDLLETAAAVYERNGDYALSVFSSAWCRFMDQASRNGCRTPDNCAALESGRWHCHQSCRTEASKRAMERGEPVDIACRGGIRLYALPIRSGDEIVGSINFGYGDPPRDPAKLQELAELYGVSVEELAGPARAYESRPSYIIELAKRRIEVSARLIGEIVERKKAEQERVRMEEQLQQAQKMESVGRLAGGVAHDFNNMLSAILGHTELAMMQSISSEPVLDHLKAIKKASLRSADLVRQLLAFARKQTVLPKVLDLNDTVGGMFKMLKRLIGEDIDLVWKPGAGLWAVKMDPSQIDQILANFCVNARDAIAGVGKVTIETENSAFDEAYCAVHPGFSCGEYVMLAVRDDGCGMTKELIDHIFEPFYTTKEVGKGTGLGLATVYGIVKQNEGFINVHSEPGKGTSFKIYLPRFVGKALELAAEGMLEIQRGGGEMVLLVEDEAASLEVGKAMLERLGYAVVTAGTPGEALRQALAHAAEIRLLITDVIMPEMNGLELAQKISEITPGLKCLFASGYTANVIAHHGVLDEGVQFIQKPFPLKDLASKVREVLGKGQEG